MTLGTPVKGSLSATPLPGQIIPLRLKAGEKGTACRPSDRSLKPPAAAHLLVLCLDPKANCELSAAVGDCAALEKTLSVRLTAGEWTLVPLLLPSTAPTNLTEYALRLQALATADTTVFVAVPDTLGVQAVAPQLLCLGTLLQGAGLYEPALATWEQYGETLQGTPAAARALLYQGDALKGLGKPDEAIERYQAALTAVDPTNAKPGVADVGNYSVNRLASDLGPMIRSRMAALVPKDKLTDKDVAALEALAAVWPPTPASKQAAFQLAQHQIQAKQVTTQTVSYLIGIFDQSGDHTSPHKTKLADNQPLLDRVSQLTDKSLLIEAMALLSQLGPEAKLGGPLPTEALPAAAEAWQRAESIGLRPDVSGAPDAFAAVMRKYRKTILGSLGRLAAGQWAHYTGAYRAAHRLYLDGYDAAADPMRPRFLLGLTEVALSRGDRGLARTQLQEVIKSVGDRRLMDWATYRLAQCYESNRDWTRAAATYADLSKSANSELGEEARMAAVRLSSLGNYRRAERPTVRYLGEDRSTQGDWYTYYGSEAFILCAQQAPQDIAGGKLSDWVVKPSCGNAAEKVRYWVTGLSDDHPSMLYNPLSRARRAANWDDRGEAYPRGTGPDLWLEVPIPEGEHRLSLYFVNDHNYYEPRRVYTISVLDEAGRFQTSAEVRHSVNGVYEQFSTLGPCTVKFAISRNLSMNVLLSGVFLDQLRPPTADPAGMTLGAQREPWRAWLEDRARHVSSLDERERLSLMITSARGHEDKQDVETFLAILARDELDAGRIGPAIWATERRLALPTSDQRYRLGLMRLAIDQFAEETPVTAPHRTRVTLCRSFLEHVFDSYLALAIEGLRDPDHQADRLRQVLENLRTDDAGLRERAFHRLAELAGFAKLTPQEQYRFVSLIAESATGAAELEAVLSCNEKLPNRAELRLRLLARCLTEGMMDRAQDILAQMQTEDMPSPSVANALYLFGTYYLHAGDNQKSRSYLDQLIRDYPESEWAKLAGALLRRPSQGSAAQP